jgi:hypothetical protein
MTERDDNWGFLDEETEDGSQPPETSAPRRGSPLPASWSDPQPAENPPQHPAVRNYIFLCLVALVVLFLVLIRRGLGPLSFLPIIVAALGVALRWRAAPLFSLILVVGLLAFQEPFGHPRPFRSVPVRTFRLDDWVLCGAVLAFFAAHYRLQALTLSVIPVDPRLQEGARLLGGRPPRGPASGPSRRDPRLVAQSEIGWLVLSLPVWALLAQVCWKLLPDQRSDYGLSSATWQGVIMAWGLGLGLFVVAGLLGYAGRRQGSRREAALLLQDVVWLETHRDQRRVNRWLAWAALRRRRRKDES